MIRVVDTPQANTIGSQVLFGPTHSLVHLGLPLCYGTIACRREHLFPLTNRLWTPFDKVKARVDMAIS